MLACTGNHEIEAQSDGNNTVFKSVQTRWKVGWPVSINQSINSVSLGPIGGQQTIKSYSEYSS